MPGNFNCSCPKGYEGDGTKGVGCRRKRLNIGIILLYVALGTAFPFFNFLFSWGFFSPGRRLFFILALEVN